MGAAARAHALALADDSAHGDPGAVFLAGHLSQRAVDPFAKRVANLGQRVRGEECPEGLLLEPQQLTLVELVARDRRPLHAPPPARRRPHTGRWLVAEVEDRALAAPRVLLRLRGTRLRLRQHLEHSLAAAAGRVERPALDQALDRPL